MYGNVSQACFWPCSYFIETPWLWGLAGCVTCKPFVRGVYSVACTFNRNTNNPIRITNSESNPTTIYCFCTLRTSWT